MAPWQQAWGAARRLGALQEFWYNAETLSQDRFGLS